MVLWNEILKNGTAHGFSLRQKVNGEALSTWALTDHLLMVCGNNKQICSQCVDLNTSHVAKC